MQIVYFTFFVFANSQNDLLMEQETFEKCWAHSPQRAAALPFTRCR